MAKTFHIGDIVILTDARVVLVKQVFLQDMRVYQIHGEDLKTKNDVFIECNKIFGIIRCTKKPTEFWPDLK